MEMGDNQKELLKYLVSNMGDHNILLGTDWLKAHNPNIDWSKNTITLN